MRWQSLGLDQTLEEALPELIQLRRHIHRHPELSGHEQQTAALVAGELRRWGWQVREGVGRTGVLAELGPAGPGVPLVALRVDMDALPVEERSGLDYASVHQGLMHACGHDMHTVVGLGVAQLLGTLWQSDPSEIRARVRLLFQPAEETAEGATWMRADGAMDGVEALFGVHVFPSLAAGTIGVRSGSLTAAAGELEVEVLGEGGHGARPHQSTDAIWIAARVVSGLQEAISRQLDALHPVVVSFGKIEGGKAFNVIADHVRLLGTVRCLDTELHAQLPAWIEDTVQALCKGHGGEARVHYRCISPPRAQRPRAHGPGGGGGGGAVGARAGAVAGSALARGRRLCPPARWHPRHDVSVGGGRQGGLRAVAQQHLCPGRRGAGGGDQGAHRQPAALDGAAAMRSQP